jgi:hypothetical protein
MDIGVGVPPKAAPCGLHRTAAAIFLAVAVPWLLLGSVYSFQESHGSKIGKGNYQRAENEFHNEQYGIWGHSDPGVTFVTALLALVGSVQVGLFLVQLRFIRESLEPAKEAADAAKRNAQALMDAEGAHLYPVIKKNNLEDVFYGPIMWGQIADDARPSQLSVTYCLKNYGKTPAILRNIKNGMAFYPNDAEWRIFTTDSEAHQPVEIITNDRESGEITCEVSTPFNFGEARAVLRRKGELIFHGEVIFTDFFDRTFRCAWEFHGRRDGFRLYRVEERPHPETKS